MDLHVNDATRSVDVDPQRTLLSVLRDELSLTGTKYGCGEGQCGACTVLVDGQPRRSCLTTVGSVADKAITTIEGIAADDGTLHPLQEAFIEQGAMECGGCTPGMIVAGTALLKNNPSPSTSDILRNMEGHICRCGTYLRIVAAIEQAAEKMTKKGGGK